MLIEEFLKPLGLGQVKAARQLGMSLNRLNEIVLGKRGITADTALRLGPLLKTSPQFWMRLQADWDLREAMNRGKIRELQGQGLWDGDLGAMRGDSVGEARAAYASKGRGTPRGRRTAR
jgi:addiction module HigA family antidote